MAQDPSTTVSLVVTGAMNPRIHHPAWYRAIDAISKDAEQLALNDSEMIVMEVHAQFKTAEYRIVCEPDKWTIQSSESGAEKQFADLARIVFDVNLHETPVHAFGLNKTMHVATPCENVGERLGVGITNADLGVENFGASSGTFEVKRAREDGCRIKFQVQPSTHDDKFVFGYLNYHYTIPVQKDRHFSLGDLVDKHISEDMAEAEDLIKNLAATLGNPIQVKNGY